MTQKFTYVGSCVEADGREIDKMRDTGRQVTYRTFREHCHELDEWAKAHGYELNARQGLTLKSDWHVAYFKGRYQDVPCYYLVWSAFEHIWTPVEREGP